MSAFECLRCGNCCRPSGYVRLRIDEPAHIADHLGLTPDDFTDRFTELTHDRRALTLIEQPNGVCVFLADQGVCLIDPVKPWQCRGFPERWTDAILERSCRALKARESS